MGLTQDNILSETQLKKVFGGLHCKCLSGTGCWYYPGGDPGDGSVGGDIEAYCGIGNGACYGHDVCAQALNAVEVG